LSLGARLGAQPRPLAIVRAVHTNMISNRQLGRTRPVLRLVWGCMPYTAFSATPSQNCDLRRSRLLPGRRFRQRFSTSDAFRVQLRNRRQRHIHDQGGNVVMKKPPALGGGDNPDRTGIPGR
jgi:hypothetical protein